MNTLTGLREAITAKLAEQPSFSGCTVTGEFPAGKQPYPLERPVVVVGLEALDARGSMGGLVASGPEGERYGSLCTVTVRFDLFAPARKEGPLLHSLLEALWECLFLEENTFGFTSMWSEAIAWDSKAEASRLTARGKLTVQLTRRVQQTAAEQFVVVRKSEG